MKVLIESDLCEWICRVLWLGCLKILFLEFKDIKIGRWLFNDSGRVLEFVIKFFWEINMWFKREFEIGLVVFVINCLKFRVWNIFK